MKYAIFTTRRVLCAGLLAAALSLSACGALPHLGGGLKGAPAARSAPRAVHVGTPDIVIAGPPGFCVDPAFTRDGADGAFVLLASCASITGSAKQPKPAIPAILTATIASSRNSHPVAQSVTRLKAFFRSPAGRAALSRNDAPKSIEVLETRAQDGVFHVHARDQSSTRGPAQQDYWRAMFDVKGRLVSAALMGAAGHRFAPDSAFRMLQLFANKMIADNAETGLVSSPRPLLRPAIHAGLTASLRPHPRP